MGTNYSTSNTAEIARAPRVPCGVFRTTLHARIAMRIGLRLVLWGTRSPPSSAGRALHLIRREAKLAQELREREYIQVALHLMPLR